MNHLNHEGRIELKFLSYLKANALAIERIREMDEQERMEKMSTKQKRGTPIVRKRIGFSEHFFKHSRNLQ